MSLAAVTWEVSARIDSRIHALDVPCRTGEPRDQSREVAGPIDYSSSPGMRLTAGGRSLAAGDGSVLPDIPEGTAEHPMGRWDLAFLATGDRLASRRRQGVHADVAFWGRGLAGSNSPDPLEDRCVRVSCLGKRGDHHLDGVRQPLGTGVLA